MLVGTRRSENGNPIAILRPRRKIPLFRNYSETRSRFLDGYHPTTSPILRTGGGHQILANLGKPRAGARSSADRPDTARPATAGLRKVKFRPRGRISQHSIVSRKIPQNRKAQRRSSSLPTTAVAPGVRLRKRHHLALDHVCGSAY
jgi:hypothetical protein